MPEPKKLHVKWNIPDDMDLDLSDSPGVPGTAEVREPVRRRAGDAMTIEGEIAAFGDLAQGLRDKSARSSFPTTVVTVSLVAIVGVMILAAQLF